MKNRFPVTKLLPMLDEGIAGEIKELLKDDLESAELQRKSVSLKADTIDEEGRSIERYISTRDIDRDGEILLPRGAIMDDYKKNPVVLWAHNYSLPPHAKSEFVKADGYGIKAKTVYAETERAEEIWTLIKGGYLNAASVGFIALEYADNPNKSVWHWGGKPSAESWDDLTVRLAEEWQVKPKLFADVKSIYTKWLLLEYSDVPVPSNASALIQRAKSLNISAGMLESLGIDPEEDGPEVKLYQPEVARLPEVSAMPKVYLPRKSVEQIAREIIEEQLVGRI